MKKAFTIIELIVVVAIIGILSSVVMFLVSKPGNQAADNAVKANLLTVRKQSEVYYISGNTYGSVLANCTGGVFNDPTVVAAIAEVKKHLGGSGTVTCSGNENKWALKADSLKSTNETWCVDSSGFFYVGNLSEAKLGQCE